MKRASVVSACLLICTVVFGYETSLADLRLTAELAESLRYESNIFLRPNSETSDTVNDLSLSLGLEEVSSTRTLYSHYTISAINFKRYSDGNYIGHSFDLGMDQQLSRHFVFTLNDTFYLSEEPAEPDPEITAVRDTRDRYYRNTVESGISYLFGEEDRFGLTYTDSRLWNEAEDVEDDNEYGPSVELEYWLTHRHGLSLSYSWRRVEYEYSPANERNTIGAGYRFRSSPHTTWSADYSFETFMEQGAGEEDYNVHNWSAGVEHDLGPHMHVGISLGYYLRDPEDSPHDTGISYTLSLARTFGWGSVSLTGAGGQRGEYTDAENRGFTEYRSVSLAGSYTLSPRTGLFATVSYSHEESQGTEDTRDDFWSATSGTTYQILPWLSCSLDLTQRERSSSDPDSEYRDTTILLRLSGTHEWR